MKMNILPRVLLIDDDNFFREFYKAELAQYNFRVDFAEDGELGIAKAKELKPDVILLDVILPKKDGFEVLDELKKTETTKDIPVIIISTLGTEDDVEKLMKLGAIKSFNKITNLPREVAEFVKVLLKDGESVAVEKQASAAKETKSLKSNLSTGEITEVFEKSLKQIEGSFVKMFAKKPRLEDMNATLILSSTLQQHIEELTKQAGTIFVYGGIRASVPGIAILVIKRNDALGLIKLIENNAQIKGLALEMGDRVIEEFFNIIINAFLTKLSDSVKGNLLLESPQIVDAKEMLAHVSKLKLAHDNLVVFLEESYTIEEVDLGFSFFVTFGNQLLS